MIAKLPQILKVCFQFIIIVRDLISTTILMSLLCQGLDANNLYDIDPLTCGILYPEKLGTLVPLINSKKCSSAILCPCNSYFIFYGAVFHSTNICLLFICVGGSLFDPCRPPVQHMDCWVERGSSSQLPICLISGRCW